MANVAHVLQLQEHNSRLKFNGATFCIKWCVLHVYMHHLSYPSSQEENVKRRFCVGAPWSNRRGVSLEKYLRQALTKNNHWNEEKPELKTNDCCTGHIIGVVQLIYRTTQENEASDYSPRVLT